MTGDRAEGIETIAADAGALYDLVSDLTQMGKWSPEATGGSWAGGATGPAVGASFHGDNRYGLRRWSTTSKITTADRGQRFAASGSPSVSRSRGSRSRSGPMTSSPTATARASSSDGTTCDLAG